MQIIKPSCSSRTNVVKCSVMLMIHRISMAFNVGSSSKMTFFCFDFYVTSQVVGRYFTLQGSHSACKTRPKSLRGDTGWVLEPKDQCFLCRHLNIFELAFMDNSGNVTWPFHTCQSLSLCFVMPLKLTESHFCRCLRKAWVEKRRTKIQGERSSTRSHTCRTPAAPGSHETCRRFDWILLGFSNWHVLGMMIPYDTLCTNWLCNSKILCHCAVAKIDKKYKESCVWFGWFSLAFCDCDVFLGLQRCVLWRLWGDGVNSEGSDMYKTPMEFFQGQVTVQIPRFQQTGSQRTWSVLEANNAADAPPVLRLRLPNAWDFLSPTYRKLRWEEATYLNNQKCLDVSLNFSESEVH